MNIDARRSNWSRMALSCSALFAVSGPSLGAPLEVHSGRFYIDFDDGTAAICEVIDNSVTSSFAGTVHGYKSMRGEANAAERRALNPQPLPPKETGSKRSAFDR